MRLLWSFETLQWIDEISISSDGSFIIAGLKDGDVYALNFNGELI